jgi:hypothetical protein
MAPGPFDHDWRRTGHMRRMTIAAGLAVAVLASSLAASAGASEPLRIPDGTHTGRT